MTALQSMLVQSGLPLLAGVLAREIASLGTKAISLLANNPKTAALGPVVEVLEECAQAALNAGEASFKANSNAKSAGLAAVQAALAILKAEEGKLVDAAKAEADSLLKVPQVEVTTPGNVTVNMPKAGE